MRKMFYSGRQRLAWVLFACAAPLLLCSSHAQSLFPAPGAPRTWQRLAPDFVFQPAPANSGAGGGGGPLDAGPLSTVVASWEGIPTDFTLEPPDPHGAAGPNGILQVVNVQIAYWDKTGHPIWGPVPLDRMFSSVGNFAFSFDPHALYDPASGRFFALLLEEDDASQHSWLDIAVSKNSNPLSSGSADWFFYRIDNTLTNNGIAYWGDYPGLGFDSQALYTTVNMYGFTNGAAGAQIGVFDKNALINGNATYHFVYPTGGQFGGFTLQPCSVVTSTGPGNVAYFAEARNIFGDNTHVRVWALSDPLGASTLNNALVTINDNGGPPPFTGAPQPTTTITIDTLDGRTQGNAFWSNGKIWFCHTAGGSFGKSFAYYYAINVNGFPAAQPTLAEEGFIDGGPGEWTYQPSIGVTTTGDIGLVFSQSSSTRYPSIFGTTRAAGATAFDTPVLIKASPSFYLGGRWGDFGSVTGDPVDNSLWMTHEFARSSQFFDWGTWWGNLSPRFAPKLQVTTNYVIGGNGNGAIDPNECNSLLLVLTNIGTFGATNIQATLTTTTPGVIISQSHSGFPDLPVGASGTNFLAFNLSTFPTFVCGLPIDCQLLLKTDQGTFTNLYSIPTGTLGVPLRIDNNSFAFIPDVGATNSVVVVSNINTAIKHVAVSLYITHTFDSDLVLQLIAPDGTTNLLSSHNGANGQNYGVGCGSDASRTTFDDSATNSITTGVAPYVGLFQPQQPLAIFNGKYGTNVNGTWQLVVSDTFPGDVGAIQCWSLLLTPAVCTDGGGECPGADMAIGMVSAPEPAIIGANLTYTLFVTNRGPSSAKTVSVSQILPSSFVFVSGTSSQGSVAQAGGVVTANLGGMPAGTTATVNIVVMPTTVGAFASSATVSSEQPDFDSSNNSALIVSHVNPPTADLSVGLSAAPSSLFVGGTVSFGVAVTNNGPSSATGVLVTNIIPAGLVLVNESVSKGSLAIYGNTVVWSLGSLTQGEVANGTVAAVAAAAGSLTATARVQGNQFDPVGANNSASAVVTVGPAADLSLGLVARPNPVVLSSNVTLTASATNNGPSTATNVVISETLPSGAPIISVAVSPSGIIKTNGTTLTCNLGSMARGASATFTVVLGTTRLGTLNASANIASGITDPNPANNAAAVSVQVSQPFVNIVGAGATLTTESISPPDGSLEPGETVTIQFRLQNLGNVSNTNLVVTLASSGGVTSPSGPQTYGILTPIGIPGGVPVSRPFIFTAAGSYGGVVTATLQLQDGTNALPPVIYTFALPVVSSFANTNTITIPDPNAPTAVDQYGPAAPYPSTIPVTGLTGQVGKVTATLYGLTHDFVHDVSVLLVGPTGAKTLLLSHAADVSAVANATLTFDDTAATNIPPSGTTITSGAWQPSAYAPQPIFSNPAPAGPYSAAMATFSGVNPNGTWSLFVLDDNGGDAGYIATGWSLNFTNLAPINQVADLGLAVLAGPNPVLVGSDLTYTFTVTNAGPNSASGVTFSNTLPAGVTLVSATVSQGNAVVNGNTIIGNLGSLGVNSSATVTIVVSPTVAAPSSLINVASVSAFETDFHLIDNTASVVSTVNLPQTDLGLTLVSSPNSVIAGSNVTSTITVTNNGPGVAFSTVVTSPITPAAAFVSATASTGSVATNSSGLVATLGDLAPGDTETVTVTVAPRNPGFLTNSASVTTASIDTSSGNNSGTAVVTVTQPAPIIVAAGAQLISENLIANGAIDPGETVTIAFSLVNTGVLDTVNLGATLLVSGGVTAPSPASNYFGRLVAEGSSVARSFTFTASPSVTTSVVASLQVQDGANNLGVVPFTFGVPSTSTFANTNAIIIPDHGPGAPYPSTINVAGVGGFVSKATVTLQGLGHTFPSDVNVLLVSPAGSSTLLMSHAGGGYPVTNLTLTFDDAAAKSVPYNTLLSSGTFRPARYDQAVTFPSSAPAGPYGFALSSLNGASPNGAWLLYVLDDRTGDAGVIATGWSLSLTTLQPVNPLADVALGLTGSPASLYVGSALTYNLSVTNLGPSSGPAIVVTNRLPSGIQLVSTTPSLGGVSVSANTLTWNLGTLAPGSMASLAVRTAPAVAGTLLDAASVSGEITDLNLGNNFAVTSTTVSTPAATSVTGGFAEGQFKLTVSGQPGMSYMLQGSTDLNTWVTLGTFVVPAGGSFSVVDTNTPGTQLRFYRTVRLIP